MTTDAGTLEPDTAGAAGAAAARPRRGRTATATPKVDKVLAEAVDLARAAAQEEAGPYGRVGEHLGVSVEDADARVATHAFESLDPGYPGWYWAVEVTRVPRARVATVDDVVLLPGEGAVVAPSWLPFSRRLQPGDIGVGDVLPTAPDDRRLVARNADTDAWVDDRLWLELGLGRPRVLSAEGREEAADRWYEGDHGPDAEIAKVVPRHCESCGFSVGLVGALGVLFRVCANGYAPDDGRVVSLDHGCGAHSELRVAASDEPVLLDLTDGAGPDTTTGAGDGAVEPAVAGD